MKTTIFQKPMRAAVLALCTATLSAAPMLMAQDTTTPPPQQQGSMGSMGGHHKAGKMQDRKLEMMTKNLNLTPDQVTQVKAINDDSMSQMKSIREDTSMAKADKKSKMMDLRQSCDDKIRNVLTDEQKPKYDAMQAKMKARHQKHAAGEGTPPPPPPQ